MKDSPNGISLKAFFEEAEKRLGALSADELRAILLEMARHVDPRARSRFLKQMEPPAQPVPLLENQAAADALLDDIADLERDLLEEMGNASDRYEMHGGYDNESGTAYEELGESLVDLFDRAQAAFDLGRYPVARDAYRDLFHILSEEDEYGVTITVPAGLDLQDAGARYLHALVAATPAQERAARLMEGLRGWKQQSVWSRGPTVMEVFGVGSFSPAERTTILTGLVDLLHETNDVAGDKWLRQATRLLHGRKGIEALARIEGHRRPHAYLDWLEELAGEKEPAELLQAARAALGALPHHLPLRAIAADYLYDAAMALPDVQTALEARWESYQVEPTITRLLDLWDAAADGSTRVEWARRAAGVAAGWKQSREHGDLLVEEGFCHTPDCRVTSACALLLAGAWGEAWEAAVKDPVLGWSGIESGQAIVLPFLLVFLSHGETNIQLPNLRALWQEAVERLFRWGNNVTEVHKRINDTLIAAMSAADVSPADAEKHMEWCITIAMKRVNAIADGTHRSAYDRAATLAAGVSELLRARGQQSRGNQLIESLLERHNRKPAFKKAIQACRRKSA
jgi:hypothetical protein